MTLRDPDVCRDGHRHTKVLSRRRRRGFFYRRHACLVCGHRWTSYQSLINPKRVHLR